MVTHVQVNTRKRKKHSNCPCPNGERGCEYITEKLGLKNSPSGLPAHQLEQLAQSEDKAGQGCRGNLLLWSRKERHSSEVSQNSAAGTLHYLCSLHTHSTAHRLPQPSPPRYKPAFCCCKEKEGSKLRRNALSPALSGNAE